MGIFNNLDISFVEDWTKIEILLVVVTVALSLFSFLFEMIRNRASEKEMQRFTEKMLKKANEEEDNAPTDIIEMMLKNMGEIRDYYVMSKTQARNSFALACVSCIAGFLLLVAVIVTANSENATAANTVIPAIGAAISEFVAGTALLIYRQSLKQLNHYYDALHNNERFLSVVNLVSKISEDKRDAVYTEIIQSQIYDIAQKGREESNSGEKEDDKVLA